MLSTLRRGMVFPSLALLGALVASQGGMPAWLVSLLVLLNPTDPAGAGYLLGQLTQRQTSHNA